MNRSSIKNIKMEANVQSQASNFIQYQYEQKILRDQFTGRSNKLKPSNNFDQNSNVENNEINYKIENLSSDNIIQDHF